MNGLLPDADFLSLLCSCAHLLAIEGNEVLILDLFWQSSAFQVKDSPDLYSILKIKRMNLCMLTEYFVYSQPAPEDMLTGTVSDSANKREKQTKVRSRFRLLSKLH